MCCETHEGLQGIEPTIYVKAFTMHACLLVDAEGCNHIPEHLYNLASKFEEEEKDRNPLTDSPEVVPSISVAARVVQVRSSSNEQGQSKEQHSDSIHHQGKAAVKTRTDLKPH